MEPEISICTTCANRVHQLSKVFEANNEMLSSDPGIEWVILNYNSKDTLHEFIQERLPFAPNLRYFLCLEDISWHASRAKNTAHRLARGKILMNLDSDNLIGGAIGEIRHYWSQGCKLLHLWSGIYRDGTCGRIVIARELFHQLGGYDEDFLPMGYQDRDLIYRASALGHPLIHSPCPQWVAVQNTKEDSIRYCAAPGGQWENYDRANMAVSQRNIHEGRLVANVGREWGGGRVKGIAPPRCES